MVGWMDTVQSETFCQDMTNTRDVTLVPAVFYKIKTLETICSAMLTPWSFN
jgi:hypothetical protein